MKEYEVVIGLETHVHLATESKVFCGCSTKFGQTPNTSTCPVCLGLPGVLPVLNEKAFFYAVKTALALNCVIESLIKFDRKNYYYPDLPKNYQISQYDRPLGMDGFLEFFVNGKKRHVKIKRVHLEEDAGKLVHSGAKGPSLVDYNRAGCPLLEIVSEPEIQSPEEAHGYLTALKTILQYLKVSDCNMEEGSLRCDANISIRPKGENALGVKVEIKNMNSFKAVREALHYESKRQMDVVAKGGEKISQETRLWNAEKCVTLSMRSKEETEDYRYFPEPDLVPFAVAKERIEEIKEGLPELAAAKKERFLKTYKLSEYECELLTRNSSLADFFEATSKCSAKPKSVANWLLGDISAFLNQEFIAIGDTSLKPEHLASLVLLVESGKITGKTAKEILPGVIKNGLDPKEIVSSKGLTQISDSGELSRIAEKVIAENGKSANDYKNGKEQALKFLIGQVMRITSGKANPEKVRDMLKEKLKG